MSSSKVVYLDFDGVLHPSSPMMDGLFSRSHLLEPLFENSNAEIVISSSWRFTHTPGELQAKLTSHLAQRVIGMTDNAVIGKHTRYQEILHHVRHLEPHTTWRALDNFYLEFPTSCNPNTGIGPKEIAQLRTWLAM
jgi:hypothetical protein